MPEEAPVMKIFVMRYFTQLARRRLSPARISKKTRDNARAFLTRHYLVAAAAFFGSALAGAGAKAGAGTAATFNATRARLTN